MSYNRLFKDRDFDKVFEIERSKHPILVKEHLQNNISLETLILLDKILGFKKEFDRKLEDPVWKFLSMRMEKYTSFININVFRYKKLLKQVMGV